MFSTRIAALGDAKKLSKFVEKLDQQSQFLLYEPNERNCSIEHALSYLDRINKTPRSAVYIAINEQDDIIGFVCGETSKMSRFSHVMNLNIGVLDEYRRIGVAKKLSDQIISHAIDVGVSRFEAAIVANNYPSLSLAMQAGFVVEGTKRAAIKINNCYHDVYMLSRILV